MKVHKHVDLGSASIKLFERPTSPVFFIYMDGPDAPYMKSADFVDFDLAEQLFDCLVAAIKDAGVHDD